MYLLDTCFFVDSKGDCWGV